MHARLSSNFARIALQSRRDARNSRSRVTNIIASRSFDHSRRRLKAPRRSRCRRSRDDKIARDKIGSCDSELDSDSMAANWFAFIARKITETMSRERKSREDPSFCLSFVVRGYRKKDSRKKKGYFLLQIAPCPPAFKRVA